MYPELWACTIVNLTVVCLLAYKFLNKSILVWLGTQIFGIAYTPSCLKNFATGSVNGALWTIFTELQLYPFTPYKGIANKIKQIWITRDTLLWSNVSFVFPSPFNMVDKMEEQYKNGHKKDNDLKYFPQRGS